jgi:hypothetical protein
MAIAMAFGRDLNGRDRRGGPTCPCLAYADAAFHDLVANPHRMTREVTAAIIESVRNE